MAYETLIAMEISENQFKSVDDSFGKSPGNKSNIFWNF